MIRTRFSLCVGVTVGLLTASTPSAVSAATHLVAPGESIQAAVNAAAPGDTVKVLPGDYVETHGGSAAVRVTKPLKLVARSSRSGIVRILPGPGNLHGILVEPATPGDPDVDGVRIKGFTVEGFSNIGIWTRYVRNFKIDRNVSIDNLENGIFPTLSANGLVKKNVAYGSEDAALWVEASENIRVIKNELHHSPTGLEVTVSKNILMRKNDVHDNTIGVGLYHPNGAALPPLGGDGDWQLIDNHIHDNNEPNSAPPSSLAASLPPGGGVLVLGVDRVYARNNRIENNDFFGIAVIDWCLAVDCVASPPVVEPYPDDNTFIANTLVNNGTDPTTDPEFALFAFFAADITYLLADPGHSNCFANNTYTTLQAPFQGPILANSCS